MNNFNTIILENGVKVVTVPMDNTNATTVLLLFGAGSRYETPKIAGSSHLFEHLLFKGTKKRKTPKEIAQIVESKGGILNAYTDKESTGYWCKVPSTSYEEGIEVLIDMAKQPLIREEDLAMEKNVVYEEIKAYLDSTSSRASNNADENLWPNQPMGVDIAGSIETVEATSRDDLMKYLNKQYTSSNTVLVVTGNIDEQIVRDIAKENFEGFREGDPLTFKESTYNNTGPITIFDKMETNQTHLTLAFKNYSMRNISRHSASILSVILGGGMTSRLFEQVREKRGLAYSVSSNAHFYSDCGVFYIDAGVAPENTEETFNVIIQELNNLKSNLNIDEVSSSKELIKGRMMMRYEDSRSVAMNYGTQELLKGKITSIGENLKSLEKVKYDEIIEAFSYIFNNATMIVSAAGSVEKIPDLTKNKDFF
ncbi:MAG: M16 family metallopeptidase [Dehalococcoidia bacterium]